MPGGMNNTDRIKLLEDQVNNISGMLGVCNAKLAALVDALNKCATSAESHEKQITIVEQKLGFVVEVREYLQEVVTIKTDLVGVKKDVEALGQRSEEARKGKEEDARHRRSYGPALVGAIVGAMVGGIMTLTGVLLTYWLTKPK